MGDWPSLELPPPPALTIYSPDSVGPALIAAAGTAPPGASTAYPVANLALYIPFVLASPRIAESLYCFNGATASGNIDLGLYDEGGTRLASAGSTAQTGANTVQVFNIADTLLGAGLYFLAVAMDNVTGTLFRATVGGSYPGMLGCFQQATAFPLPATATFAACSTNYVPFIGVGFRSVI